MNRIRSKIQARVGERITKKAMRKLLSLPDGVEMTWNALFLGEVSSPYGFIFHHPILSVEFMFVVDQCELIDRFMQLVKQEGYIIDDSNCACTIGGEYRLTFRFKENLLNKFADVCERKVSTENDTNFYYIKEIFENRNGKKKPLQLYRIPHHSSTGRVRIHQNMLWITTIVLNGRCIAKRGVVTDDKERFQFGDDDYILQENEDYTFENFFKSTDTNEYSWYELNNSESEDLLMLVLPVDDNLI